MSLEIPELERLITPMDKMVVQYLQQNKSGVTIMDIVHRIKSEVGEDRCNLDQAVSGVLANAIELGFIEMEKPDEACLCEGKRRRASGRLGRGRSRSRASRARRRRRCIRRRRVRPRGI